jgi:phosphoserine phosphatase RsbU/P
VSSLRRREHRALVLLAILAVGYRLLNLALSAPLLVEPENVALAPFEMPRGTNTVSRPGPAAAEAGLARGDRLVAVEGRPYRGRSDLGEPLANQSVGGTLRVAVRSEGEADSRILLLPLQAPSSQGLPLLLLGLLVPLFCMALGFGVAAIRPLDPRAWILLMLLLGFGQFTELKVAESWRLPGPIAVFAGFYAALMQAAWPLGMLMFGVRFPERLALDRRAPWLKWLLVAPIALSALLDAGAAVDAVSWAAAEPFARAHRALGAIPLVAGMAAIGSFFAALGYRHGKTAAADERRRLALLRWGATIGLTPVWLLVLFSLWSGRAMGELPAVLLVPALLLLAVFPLTLAYAIVVERAMDVRVVLRQGLQYALAQRGVRVVQALASLAVLVTVVSLASSPGTRRPQRLSYIGWGVTFVVVSQRLAERARAFIDTRFFGDAARREAALAELSEDVRRIVEADKLLATVCERIAESLRVPRVAALLPQSPRFAVAYAHGFGPTPAAELPGDGATLARLRSSRDALRVYFDDPDAWVNREPPPEAEARALRALETQLLLSLTVKDTLLGVLSLGPKQSEEPYAPAETRLLRGVAGATALALENARLTAAVAAEVARAARMSREIEIAHEVQEQLFPQSYPKVAGLELAGHCRPAAGVGGDYYDFVDTSAGGVGIAIGDVAGKGIPAALLMAGLQASLRGQALAGASDLAALMDRVNRQLSDASPANRYATFFYGQYDPASRRLSYVNAGHNAPMLLRGRGGERQLIRLSDGGPVVGLLYPAAYRQFEQDLRAGDLLVGFTDGISECMNPADEEWGEERLLAAIEANRELPAAALIDALMRAADAFAAGAKQHDDMTLIVIRVVWRAGCSRGRGSGILRFSPAQEGRRSSI